MDPKDNTVTQLEDMNSDRSASNEEAFHTISRIRTSGTNNEIVHIGDIKVHRHEFIEAFGMSAGIREAPTRKFGNASVLGLCAFSLTTFVLALVNINARGVTVPNIVVALAFFYGGMIQVIVGMWEIVAENTFGGCTFASYGAFYLSYGAISTPAFGIQAAYGENIAMLYNALGFYSTGWFIFSFLMLICTIRSTWPLFLMFITIAASFLLNAIGYYSANTTCIHASGGFSFATAAFGWYMAMSFLCTNETTYFRISPLFMPGAQHVPKDEEAN
ncbi:putative ammonium permease ATO2 [Sugiyamaella lignohabitans]|uniref:Putative ammonium permease ATO2 n=1 Tax=Sugiyamaella lignohabitans TaxID=796027 RepID=A0A167FZV1_9ASCO|nr:putative ammonium permease ATO2 [Sugiyamaella lignohabitans]ANB15919.1 putative ammonium permease ATO2 [Sugiyamaella lignohabitans]